MLIIVSTLVRKFVFILFTVLCSKIARKHDFDAVFVSMTSVHPGLGQLLEFSYSASAAQLTTVPLMKRFRQQHE